MSIWKRVKELEIETTSLRDKAMYATQLRRQRTGQIASLQADVALLRLHSRQDEDLLKQLAALHGKEITNPIKSEYIKILTDIDDET